MSPTIPKTLTLGPLLGLEGNYKYTVCFLLDSNCDKEVLLLKLSFADLNVSLQYEHKEKLLNHYFYRYSVIVPPQKVAYEVSYTVGYKEMNLSDKSKSSKWFFTVPGSDEQPKIGYTSCNGDSAFKKRETQSGQYEMWSRLIKEHKSDDVKFNALVMSGDQVYADSLWKDVPYFEKHNLHKGTDQRFLDHIMSDKDEAEFVEQLEYFYEQLYIRSWSTDKNMALGLASIPSIMMWDDHDIFDGYGSHSTALQETKLFNVIYKVAKRYFELFQIRSSKNTSLLDIKVSYSSRFSFRNYEFVVLDNRSNRTRKRIMHPSEYIELVSNFKKSKPKTLTGNLEGQNVLCFVIPVPIGHLDYSSRAERWMRRIFRNRFRSSCNDDGIDHWDHNNHKSEHKMLLDTILTIGRMCLPKYVVVLSGDVHSAGAANVSKEECTINQYISSAIVHKPASRLQQLVMDWLSLGKSKVENYHIELKNYGKNKVKTIYSRNFGYLYKKERQGLKGYLVTEDLSPQDDHLSKNLKLFIDANYEKQEIVSEPIA